MTDMTSMTSITDNLPPVRTLEGCRPDALPAEIEGAREPILMPGLIKGWPAVKNCQSAQSCAGYLSRFWRDDNRLTVFVGDESIEQRFFYNDDFTGFNFKRGAALLPQVLHKLHRTDRPAKESTIYIGSTPVDTYLPGFRDENDLALNNDDMLISFWMGSASRVSAHFDFPDNIACVVAGRRKITLFPPEQLQNLYIGPLQYTPAGQPISLVDFRRPDFDKYPRFKQALETAQCCELGPGDALFIPSMYWHHIEAMEPFNMLVNYWWCESPAFMGSPMASLMHAILSIRDLSPDLRSVWQNLFQHYVFTADENTSVHIPESGRGWLAPLNENSARQLRAELLNKLNH